MSDITIFFIWYASAFVPAIVGRYFSDNRSLTVGTLIWAMFMGFGGPITLMSLAVFSLMYYAGPSIIRFLNKRIL